MADELAFFHIVNGKRYVSSRNEPMHATLESYIACTKRAYGSLRGVTFGTYYRETD